MTENCLVVPNVGTVFAQVVSSEICSKWNGLHDIQIANEKITIPDDMRGSGASTLALHDLQLSQIKEDQFEAVSEVLPIFDFDFGRLKNKVIFTYKSQNYSFLKLLDFVSFCPKIQL